MNDKALLDDNGFAKICDGNHMFSALQNIHDKLLTSSAEEREKMQDGMGHLAMQTIAVKFSTFWGAIYFFIRQSPNILTKPQTHSPRIFQDGWELDHLHCNSDDVDSRIAFQTARHEEEGNKMFYTSIVPCLKRSPVSVFEVLQTLRCYRLNACPDFLELNAHFMKNRCRESPWSIGT